MSLNKHKILKHLFEANKFGEKNTGFGRIITDLGKSLSTFELNEKTNISSDKINNICFLLIQDDLIEYNSIDEKKENNSYIITEKGKKTFIEKGLLSQIWYRQRTFWLPFLALLISFSTLCWTVFRDANLDRNIDKLQQQIDSLKLKK